MTDVAVIGAGPAGAMASIRAVELGARTTLLASGAFGGMAAHDGDHIWTTHPGRQIHPVHRRREPKGADSGFRVDSDAWSLPGTPASMRVIGSSAMGAQVTSMTGGVTVEQLARVPFSFPTYAGVLGGAAVVAARAVDRDPGVSTLGAPDYA